MSQSDLNIANVSRSLFRQEVNEALQALGSLSSGATEPTTTYAYQLWADTASGLLKQRTAANDGWISKGNLADVDWGLLNKAGGTMTGLLNLAAGADIASASTVDLTAATGNCPKITGTTDIEAWTMNTGQQMRCIAGGAFKLVYDATTNNIEGGADYTCEAGDIINLVKGLDGVVRVRIEKQDGTPVVAAPDASETVKGIIEIATATEAQALTDDLRAITPLKLARAFQGGNQSLAANGFQKLPGGLIIQWGVANLGSNLAGIGGTSVIGSITFPIAFPTMPFSASVSGFVYGSTGLEANENFLTVQSFSATTLTVSATRVAGGGSADEILPVAWIAIGH